MPVKGFKAGSWYAWNGPKERPRGWNPDGEMDAVLDGKPTRCVKSDGGMYAIFENTPRACEALWSWKYGFEYWVEIPYIATHDFFHKILPEHKPKQEVISLTPKSEIRKKLLGL